ncbi:MAG: hypothetical protein IKI63_02440 [Clostridia bacterium]|nr:hypothetical protein [Clostridia bacterium]
MTHALPRRAADVRAALDQARAIADSRGLPLTPERIAACLGISRQQFLHMVEHGVDDPAISLSARTRIDRMLWQAYCDCSAELAEELLKPGSHSGAVFLGKNNFGYTDRSDREADLTVQFVGEDDIPE